MARLMARHLGRMIPGNPTIVVQNQPAAGSLVTSNYIYNTAPKDGSVIALIQRGFDANRVRQVVLVGGMLCGLAIFGAAGAHTAPMALLWISIALGGLAASAPVAWTVASLISPRESVGTLAGAVAEVPSRIVICPALTDVLAAAVVPNVEASR